MVRSVLVLFMTAGLGLATLAPSEVRAAQATDAPAVQAAAAPTHGLEVSGSGVEMFPAFAPGTERFAVTTTDATGGTVTVTATTSDPAGAIWVNGRRDADGVATVSGLSEGDEISVFIEDSAGTEVHSLVYLPAGFPALEVSTPAGDVAPGQIGLTLNDFHGGPQYLTTVDRNGVPAHVQEVASTDLKQQEDGRISVAVPTSTPGRTGNATVVMNDRWQEVARYETIDGLVDTDVHDSIVFSDGRRFLMAYEPNAQTGLTDSVIQEVDATGQVAFSWNSDSLVDETVATGKDYAHLNSLFVMPDGDVIASFRHLSAVLRIATTAHDGYQPGDIVWKLGGRDSSFSFVDDPYGGPCAQHTASVLPNGHVLVFDDGSGGLAKAMCVDPADPAGPTHERWQSRVAEYALDTDTDTATLVWSYQRPDWYSWFMGSAKRLGNGDTLIGWAAATQALASEVDATGNLVWELRLAPTSADPQPAPYISYRASLMDVPDVFRPTVQVSTPATGATYAFGQTVRAGFTCTDRGGSSLQVCGTDVRPGDRLDTSVPGRHVFTAVAEDGHGNARTVRRVYTVAPPLSLPDAQVRSLPAGSWVGGNVYAGTAQQVQQVLPRVASSVRAEIRVQHDGSRPSERFRLRGSSSRSGFKVTWFAGGRNVTRAVVAGTFTTARVDPGGSVTLKVQVTRLRAAEPGAGRNVWLRAASAADPSRWDTVATVVRARR